MKIVGGHQLVLAELVRRHRTTRSDLIDASGLSAATVSRAVESMITGGLVREVSDLETGTRGRKRVLLEVVGASAHVVGVDIGASACRLITADLVATAVHRAEVATPAHLTPTGLAEWLADTIESGRSPGITIDRVAVGLPGAVQIASRTVSNAPNLRQVEDPAFLARLEERLGLTVELDNDANYALLGEQKFGAAAHAATAGIMTVGAGLGAAVAIDDHIIRGRRGIVGEFGHMLVGPLGSRLETLVTGPMLMARAAQLGTPIESPSELFDADVPRELAPLVMQFDNALLVALTALIVSIDPEVVVIGGGIAKSLASRFDRYERELERNLGFRVPLVAAELGDFSGAIGAAVSGLQSVYRELGVPEHIVPALPQSPV